MSERSRDVNGNQAGDVANAWVWPSGKRPPGTPLVHGQSVADRHPPRHAMGQDTNNAGSQDISDGGHQLAVREAALQAEDVNQRPFSSESGEVDPDRLIGGTGNLKHVMSTALPPGIEPSDVTDPGTKARAAALAAARAGSSTEAGAAAERQTRLREQRDADNRDITGPAAGVQRPDGSPLNKAG